MQDRASDQCYAGLRVGFFCSGQLETHPPPQWLRASMQGLPQPRSVGLGPEQHTWSRQKRAFIWPWSPTCTPDADGPSLTWGMCPIREDDPSRKDQVPRVKCSPSDMVFWGLPPFSPSNPRAEQSYSCSFPCVGVAKGGWLLWGHLRGHEEGAEVL